ncbi:MAG: SDR family NAD(P)-dependent oxidoreductase [Vicinamibacterales bacterium]
MSSTSSPETGIAIVGMAGRFPGARTVREYWRNVREGREALVCLSDDDLRRAGIDERVYADPHYVKAAMPLAGVAEFDAAFFGFSPREAAILDPQHRHFLECAWEALEDAGHVPDRFDGAIGVFGGCGMNAYFNYHLLPNHALMSSTGLFLVRHTGNDKDFLTTRVSYLLNLTGPSIGVQTACSTSLVAVHLACESLLAAQCDLALAGGVTIELPQGVGYRYEEGEILSPDGHCRAFDAAAKGTIFGSGLGVVALRRLADALDSRDHIYAVIRGSATNNDGSAKVGYLAPSVDGQAKAIHEAIAVSGIDAASIGYVETHGTGTPLGDPIEVSALTQAFRQFTPASGFCAIGSVKTNIGHLDTAAGVASLIKAAMAVHDGVLPASLNYTSPNPVIDFPSTPFVVNATTREWPPTGVPRRAGVNSLGVGGTNAHVVLEEAPPRPGPDARHAPATPLAVHVLPLSARSAASLDRATERLADELAGSDHPIDAVAFTLQRGRRPFAHRRAIVATSTAEASVALRERPAARTFARIVDPGSAAVFVFPGGGAQYPRMGADLYASEPAYREALELGLAASLRLGLPDVRPHLFAPPERTADAATALARPAASILAIFLVEYALAELWRSRGVEPAALMGHSLGEYTAAHLAGVFSLDDALRIVGVRGEVFERMPAGAMLSVALSEDDVRPLLPPEVSLAAVNGPELCVLSGPVAALAAVEQTMAARGVEAKRLHIDVAAHSAMLEPFLEEFRRRIADVAYHVPTRPLVSNVTGTWAAEDVANAEYWTRHLRACVRFSSGVALVLAGREPRVLLEVGPGVTLTALARQQLSRSPSHAAVPSMRHPQESVSDLEALAVATARLWACGVDIDWEALHPQLPGRVSLPTYAWDHQQYWIDAPPPSFISGRVSASPVSVEEEPPSMVRAPVDDWFSRTQWAESPLVPMESVTPLGIVALVDASDPGHGELVRRLKTRGHRVTTVEWAVEYARRSVDHFAIRPTHRDDWEALLRALRAESTGVDRVAHLWSLAIRDGLGGGDAALADARERAFDSLLVLAQALGADEPTAARVVVVTRGAVAVGAEGVARPLAALSLGPVLTLAREYAGLSASLVDVDAAALLPIDELADEIGASSRDACIAWRGGARWRRDVASLTPSAAPSARSADRDAIPERGVVLLTGGLGGVGLAIATHLATERRARLVILGRAPLPPPDTWPALRAERREGDPVRVRLDALASLEALGADVRYVSGDVAKVDDAARAVETAVAEFGALHAIVHAAGVVDDGLMQVKDLARAHRVLAPKVAGAIALDHALGDRPLNVFVLFSSTSSALGLTGQVDYTAANAFLDAFAAYRTSRRAGRTVSIGWGVWRDEGLVARAFDAPAAATLADAPGRASHPLLGRCVRRSETVAVFEARLGAGRWELDEHRLASGRAVLPGTAHLDVLWAAARDVWGTDAIALTDILLLAPFVLDGRQERVLRVTVEGGESAATIVIESLGVRDVEGAPAPAESTWLEHARASAAIETGPERRVDLAAEWVMRPREADYFDARGINPSQAAHVSFGERWHVLRDARHDGASIVARLQLPPSCAGDLAVPRLHPAMLDMGVAAALPLVAAGGPTTHLYAPLSFGSVRVRGPLPATVTVVAALRGTPTVADPSVAFDVVVHADDGRVLVAVDDFVMRRLDHPALGAPAAPAAMREPADRARLRRWREQGIPTAQGADALMRILGDPSVGPHVFASSVPIAALLEDLASEPAGSAPQTRAQGAPSRPVADNTLSPMEAVVAEVWRQLLDVDGLAPSDDFFELGGHSLLAVRSIARLEKATGVRLSLQALFECRTLAAVAAALDARSHAIAAPLARPGPSAPARRALTSIDRSAFRVDRSTLTTRTSDD